MRAGMRYGEVADAYEAMGRTTKRTELTELLARLLAKTPVKLLDKVIYLTQGKLYPDYVGVEIGVGEKLALRTVALALQP